MSDRTSIVLHKPEHRRLFKQARHTLKTNGKNGDPNNVDVATKALDVYTNSRDPPIRRIISGSRAMEYRGELAQRLDADPLELSPYSIMRSAIDKARGCCSAEDFEPSSTEPTSVRGYEQAAERAGADPENVEDALEAIFTKYLKLSERQQALSASRSREEA